MARHYNPNLTEREKLVYELRVEKGLTLQSIADQLGLTRERIRQIEAKAIRKKRRILETDNEQRRDTAVAS